MASGAKNLGCGLLLFGGLIWFLISFTESEQSKVNKPSAPPSRGTVHAGFAVIGDSRLEIRNRDHQDWPQLEVFVNSDPPFGFSAAIRPLKVGETATYRLNDFAKDSDGERFNPFTHKVLKVWIGGNGFDYQSYGF